MLVYSGPLTGTLGPPDANAVLASDSGPDSWFGYYGLDAVEDITGDGMPDLVAGDAIAEIDGQSRAGAVLVWSAPLAGAMGEADAVAKLIGEPNADAVLGVGTASPGDLDGDGIGELLAAMDQPPATVQSAGGILMAQGPVVGTLVAANVDAWIYGHGHCDYLGRQMAAAGDVDGDGTDDWLAGAFFATRDQGEQGAAYLFTDVVPGISGEADDLATAVLLGEDAEDLAGNAVRGIGDLDGDGWADFAVGAYREDSVGYDIGAAYVIPGPIEGTVDLGLAPWKLVGEYVNDEAGGTLAAGELDGDGLPDLVVAAPMNDAREYHCGKVYLVSGAVLLE